MFIVMIFLKENNGRPSLYGSYATESAAREAIQEAKGTFSDDLVNYILYSPEGEVI